MKFDFDKYKYKKVVMHCKTEEEANDFCRVMDEAGLRWITGERYTKVLAYERYRQKTCYQFNCGGFASKEFFVEEGYEILEWSDFMNKQFTKSDIRNGDVLVKRNGCVEIAIPEVGVRITEGGGYNELDALREDLTNLKAKDFDIMNVYRPKRPCHCCFNKTSLKEGELVFDRTAIETVYVTLEEIAKLKGVSVDRIKIVNG